MRIIKKILSFVLSPLHLIVYGFLLLVFHGLQWLALNLAGQKYQQIVADYLNGILIKSLWIVGITTKFINPHNLPTDRPLIFVANHQSHYDISPIAWYLRKNYPKFLAKIELDSSIPSIGYNLRHGGSIFVDLENPRQTLIEIKKLSTYIDKNNYSAVIFPEGQRNYDGMPSEFFKSGLKMLIKFTPRALVVPITINNAWKILENGYFQMPLGQKTTWTVHKPYDPKDYKFDELFEKVKMDVVNSIDV